MKKSLIIAALGLAGSAVSSLGAGSILFNSYLAGNNDTGVPVYFIGGGLVGAGFTADLLYSLTPITDSAGFGPLNPGWSVSGSGAPSLFNVATPFETGFLAGYFQSPQNFVLNPYTAGSSVYFEVIAYDGSSYASATARGHSASFSATLATGVNLPVPINFTSFTVTPEPATLALAGLGALVSVMALRRKTE
jgi:hypothetical protein